MLPTIRGSRPGIPIVERMRIRCLLCLPVNLPPGLTRRLFLSGPSILSCLDLPTCRDRLPLARCPPNLLSPCPILAEMFFQIRAESFGPLLERVFHCAGDDGCGAGYLSLDHDPSTIAPSGIAQAAYPRRVVAWGGDGIEVIPMTW